MALALRPNRIKNRDLWGITWLRQQAVDLPLPLIVKKIADHKQTTDNYSTLLEQRIAQLQSDTTQQASFNQEMRRFLPPGVAKRTVESAQFWEYLCTTVVQEGQGVLRYLANESPPNDHFKM